MKWFSSFYDKHEFAINTAWGAFWFGGAIKIHDTILLPQNYREIDSIQEIHRKTIKRYRSIESQVRSIDPYEETSDKIFDDLTKIRKSLIKIRKVCGDSKHLGNIYDDGYQDGYDEGHRDGYSEGSIASE